MRFNIVVCAESVPDPLQTLDPITLPAAPASERKWFLPAVLDHGPPAHSMKPQTWPPKSGSKLWLVSLGPRPSATGHDDRGPESSFELVPVTVASGIFPTQHSTAAAISSTIESIPKLETRSCSLGGWDRPAAAPASPSSSTASASASPIQFQASIKSPCAMTAPLKSWSASKAASIRSPSAPARRPYSAGPPATSPSRAIIPGRHGQHAQPHARPAKSKSATSRQQPALHLRQPSQAAARHPRSQRHVPRRNRQRASRMDRSRMMESILVLTHADETGSAPPKPRSKP